MTRENKIGLLAGMCFVIAVGILMSQYLTVANERPPAQLQAAGQAVRSTVDDAAFAGPAFAGPAFAPSARSEPVVRVPQRIAPPQPLVTATEMVARARVPIIDSLPPTAMATQATAEEPASPAVDPKLLAAAARAGQGVVAVNAAPVPTPAARTVTAKPGDSLGDLAQRAFGTNTRSSRGALVAANPSLKADPGHVVAGRAYAVGGPDAEKPAAAATVATWYTVQPGDTLWSIATAQVGTSHAVAAIRELNRDVLHGDRVHPKMRLRLPKKNADA